MPDNLMNKYRKNIKNIKCRTIPKISHSNIFCPYEEKKYWKNVLFELERKYRRQCDTIKFNDFITIPPELYERVSKLIQITPLEDDTFEDESSIDNLSTVQFKFEKSNINTELLESKLSPVTKSSLRQLALLTKEKLKKSNKNENWIKNYAVLTDRQRIKWNTKYYDLNKDKHNRPLIEKAEEVMDQAAKRFSEFVNNLGPDKTGNISKDEIKSLFVINLDGAKESNHVNDIDSGNIVSKKSSNIFEELSKSFKENPEFIEFQKMKQISKKRKQQNLKIPKIAFGRTMKTDDDKILPFKITDDDRAHQSNSTYLPEELCTGEIIFSGICNLRVTKDLIQYYLENEHLKRPEYLVKNGCFNRQADTTKRRISINPFYECVKN